LVEIQAGGGPCRFAALFQRHVGLAALYWITGCGLVTRPSSAWGRDALSRHIKADDISPLCATRNALTGERWLQKTPSLQKEN
jgi:hypothetical protein